MIRAFVEGILAIIGYIFLGIGSLRPYWALHHHNTGLYMERWWILGGSHPKWDDRQLGPVNDAQRRSWHGGFIDRFVGRFFALRLHRICTPDDYRELHSHPFSFAILILWGGYIEKRPKRREQHPRFDLHWFRLVRRRAGSISIRSQNDRHAIVKLHLNRPVLTLCLLWGHKQPWGFYSETGKISPQVYRWLEQAITEPPMEEVA